MTLTSIVKNKQGQASIEFALTMILLLSFVLFYFQLTLVFAFGSYAHYATFMAARAYLSSSSSQEDQIARAKYVIVDTLKKSQGAAGTDRFPSFARSFGQGDPVGTVIGTPQNGDSTWMQGIRYTFKSKLFLVPLSGKGERGPASQSSVTFISESWLGRESAYEDCQGQMGKGSWLFDNGC